MTVTYDYEVTARLANGLSRGRFAIRSRETAEAEALRLHLDDPDNVETVEIAHVRRVDGLFNRAITVAIYPED